MRRRMLKSKIHRATVTDANLNYVGSISLDTELMSAADIAEWEQVAVLDIDNGARFETYAIAGTSGQVCLNGAAARLVQPGDKVIVLTYADYADEELEGFAPTVVHVDEANRAVGDGLPAQAPAPVVTPSAAEALTPAAAPPPTPATAPAPSPAPVLASGLQPAGHAV